MESKLAGGLFTAALEPINVGQDHAAARWPAFPCYTAVTSERPRFTLPASDPSFSPLLRLSLSNSARASHQMFRIPRDAGVVMSTKLYVGNLPYQTTEADLQTLFEPIGPVDTINVVKDRATGQARGFAFVEMSTPEGASRAISELDRRDFGGRSLTVNEAKPMTDRANGGGAEFGGRSRRDYR
jgi:hypothetical protein